MSLKHYLVCHLRDNVNSLGKIYQTPITSLLIILAIGCTLAMPTSLALIMLNLNKALAQWQGAVQVTVFANQNLTSQQVEDLTIQLKKHAESAEVLHLTPEQALKDFEAKMQIQQAVTPLATNPLPHVFSINLPLNITQAEATKMTTAINTLNDVDEVFIDYEWIKQLSSLQHLLKYFTQCAFVILGLAVMFIVSNTIRLSIAKNQASIEVTYLFGATKAFVRRNYIYLGLWLGILGALVTLLLIQSLSFGLNLGLDKLNHSFSQTFGSWHYLSFTSSLALLICGALMGGFAAWRTVNNYLNQIAY